MRRTASLKLWYFAAALACGGAVWYWQWAAGPAPAHRLWATRPLTELLIYLGCFAAAALAARACKSPRLTGVGWALVAVLGAALCALVDEYVFVEPDEMFAGVNMFLVGFVLYSSVSLPIMGLSHALWRLLHPRLS